MSKKISSKALPHIVAVISFFIISFIYFSPVLDGKELVGHDTESWMGMYQESKVYNETHDDPALWTNSMFGGMPTYQIGIGGAKNVLPWILAPIKIFPRVIYTLFLYLIGFYILLLAFKVNPWLSIVCSIGFAFGSYNFIILMAGHNTKAIAIAYMAPLIGSVIYTFRQKKSLGFALSALFFSLAIAANHLQIFYYTLICLGIYGLSELFFAIKEKKIKGFSQSTGLTLAALAIAVGINAVVLWTTKEYSEYTMRGKSNGLSEQVDKSSHQEGLSIDYITQWSYGIDETMTLLIPDFKGGASHSKLSASSNTATKLREMGVADVDNIIKNTPMPTYWGTQPFTSGPVYAGAIICFLFVLGLYLVEGKNKWWLLIAFVLSILLSWGHNFMPFTEFFVNYIPMYGKFRTVSMTLVITCFVMAFMGALALKEFFSSSVSLEKKKKSLYLSAGIVGGITLIFALIPSLAGDFKGASDSMLTQYGYPDFIQQTLPQDRMDMLRSDAFRSFVFIALAFIVLWLYISKNLKLHFVYGALAILLLADMVPVAKRYLNNDNFHEKKIGSRFTPTTADKLIMQDQSEFRVLDLTVDIFNSSKPAYFHHCIGGYHAAKLRRYQELINYHISREISNIGSAFQSAQKAQSMDPIFATLSQSQVLNMLNMKYVIYNGGAEPIKNPFANGTVWFVDTCYIAQTPDEEMLKLGAINTKTELVADKMFADLLPTKIIADSMASISQVMYSPNEVVYESNSSSDQVAVFSEIYYEAGWNAYVDGEEAPYARVNYLLRGLPVKAGKHKIVFKFEPQSYTYGSIIAMISSALLLLALAGAIFIEVKRRKKKD